MNQYTAFGLKISSEITLPPLPSSAFDAPDICIRQGPIDNPTFAIPTIGKFLVAGIEEIIFEPMPAASHKDIIPFILGSCLGILLQRRGNLVLHGNAITAGNQCVIFIGPSGAGKSTLAGGFLRQGYSILSDDLCVITPEHQVLPGYPQIKLWRDSAQMLGYDCSGLEPVFQRQDKFAIPIADNFTGSAKPLKQIYVLAPFEQTPFSSLKSLIDNTYRLTFIESSEERAKHLLQCQSILTNIPLKSLSHRAPLDDVNFYKALVLN
ncbi:MAG: hypothetical protein V4534_02225 [Myxococcota bacterium]